MKKILFCACVTIAFLSSIPGIAFPQTLHPVARRIHEIIQDGLKANAFTCRKERICGISAIPAFYRSREYEPAWTQDGIQKKSVEDLINALEAARREGLSPDIYHLSEIQSAMVELSASATAHQPVPSSTLAELDVLLTDAYLLYAAHLHAGRVNPETIHTQWVAFLSEIDLVQVLSRALESEQIGESLAALTPSDKGYRLLKEALQAYRKIADESSWPQMPSGSTLRPGDSDERVFILRQILTRTGDLPASADGGGDRFDEVLEQALRSFQYRHGLEMDGIVGKYTQSQLGKSVHEQIRRIEVNLERWRWLPHDLGKRYVLVNIADFRLSVIESGHPVLDMRVVVGTDYRRSPVFSETMKYLVFNPYWNVPFRISVKDKLPLIQKDPSYLVENGYRVYSGWEENSEEIKPESIDWSGINRANFTYRLRQDPGPKNALGRFKFMFPNRFSVYLHDTPQQALFGKTVRAFSSGCIRIEKPLDLAAYVLQNDMNWDRERIETAVHSGKNRVVILKHPIPVHLLYWTAWVDAQGTLHFRDDIYGRDKVLDQALGETPSSSAFLQGKSHQ